MKKKDKRGMLKAMNLSARKRAIKSIRKHPGGGVTVHVGGPKWGKRVRKATEAEAIKYVNFYYTIVLKKQMVSWRVA